MRSIKQIMEELGFNQNSSTDVQKAFIKHLIESSTRQDIEQMNNKSEEQSLKVAVTNRGKPNEVQVSAQLEFDLSEKKNVS